MAFKKFDHAEVFFQDTILCLFSSGMVTYACSVLIFSTELFGNNNFSLLHGAVGLA
jgi:hypothetical protein